MCNKNTSYILLKLYYKLKVLKEKIMLEKFKNMGKTLKQAQEMKGMMQEVQKELQNTVIPVSELGDKIKIEMTGELDVKSVSIDPSLLTADNKATLEQGLKKTFSIGIKKAKDLATNKLQAVTGGLLSQ